jgi:hypothetical protein
MLSVGYVGLKGHESAALAHPVVGTPLPQPLFYCVLYHCWLMPAACAARQQVRTVANGKRVRPLNLQRCDGRRCHSAVKARERAKRLARSVPSSRKRTRSRDRVSAW